MKTCKICGKSEPEVEFYKNNASKCKKCKNREDGKRKAEREGREYHPRADVEVPNGYKYCNHCKQVLPLDNFYTITKKGKECKYSRCKDCETEIVKNHPNRKKYETQSNENKLKKANSDPEYREYLNEIDKKYLTTENGIITHMLTAAKKRAAKKNLEFNLTKEDIILPEFCPILGIKLEKGTKNNYSYTYSLDRIDNSKGYVKGNVQVISQLANSMKNAATPQQLKSFSENILQYIDKT